MSPQHPADFFDAQFRHQIAQQDFALNPFERLALARLSGRVLDLGCGLGNLAVAAARRGCDVTAVNAATAAIAQLEGIAAVRGLSLTAFQAGFETWHIEGDYDRIVAIGLLMFFRSERAMALLDDIATHLRPGGQAIVNVPIEGTTHLGMFDPGNFTLFGRDELERWFAAKGWRVPVARHDEFPAPGDKLKVFSTVAAQRPAGERDTPQCESQPLQDGIGNGSAAALLPPARTSEPRGSFREVRRHRLSSRERIGSLVAQTSRRGAGRAMATRNGWGLADGAARRMPRSRGVARARG